MSEKHNNKDSADFFKIFKMNYLTIIILNLEAQHILLYFMPSSVICFNLYEPENDLLVGRNIT